MIWMAVVFVSTVLAYEYGVESTRARPGVCADRSIDGKVLTKIAFDGIVTTCTYENDYTKRSKWKSRA